jgi:hypothetical protein
VLSVPSRMSLTLDDETTAIVRREAKPNQGSAWVRTAIIEKAARDEHRAELDELRARVAFIERHLGIEQ